MTERERARHELEAWCRRYRQHLFPLEQEAAEMLLSMANRADEADELRPHQDFRERLELTGKLSFAEHVLIHFAGEIVNICLDESGAPQRDANGRMQFENTGRQPPWLSTIAEPNLDKLH